MAVSLEQNQAQERRETREFIEVLQNNHRSNLTRNLASFGLTVDPVLGDGDCVFGSIVRQLQRLPQFINEEASVMEHRISFGARRV